MPRFVVLWHQTPPSSPRASHCDLMLEMGEVLWTWELPQWPPLCGTQAVRLPDHRRDYLQYEGPLTRARGSVRRLDQGTYELLGGTHPRIVAQIAGQQHRGQLVLEELTAEASSAAAAQRTWSVGWVEDTSSEPSEVGGT